MVQAWTFGGQVPGPTIRVHLGDTVNVDLTNEGAMSHSIDFHASQTAMDHQMVEIAPGATFTYTSPPTTPGCGCTTAARPRRCTTSPTACTGWSSSSRRAVCRRSTRRSPSSRASGISGPQRQPVDYAKANAAAPAPDFVVFNGVANQYKDNPIQVTTKGRVRVFVLDVGPNVDSSFHVVGTIFDTVIKEGVVLAKGNAGGWGSQAVDLSPAQGAIIEFSPQENGMYPLVTHAFNFVGRGALGIFMAGGEPAD